MELPSITDKHDDPQECQCNCRRKILQLERKNGRLEEALRDKDAIIASLKAKNRKTTAELVEFQLHKVSLEIGRVWRP